MSRRIQTDDRRSTPVERTPTDDISTPIEGTPTDISDFIDHEAPDHPAPNLRRRTTSAFDAGKDLLPIPTPTPIPKLESYEVTMPVPDALKERVNNDQELLNYYYRLARIRNIPEKCKSYDANTGEPIFDVYKYYDVNS